MTQQAVAAENYPFCTIDPHEARCAVPDERFDYLVKMWEPPSVIPAYLNITDIAGLFPDAQVPTALRSEVLFFTV